MMAVSRDQQPRKRNGDEGRLLAEKNKMAARSEHRLRKRGGSEKPLQTEE